MTIAAGDVGVEVRTSPEFDAALELVAGVVRDTGAAVDQDAPADDPLVRHMREVQARPLRRIDLRVPFGDGVYRFALGGKEVAELERRCGYTDGDKVERPMGIGAIFARMARGRAFLPTGEPDWANISVAEVLASEVVERDCLETIRLGLIGGGEGEAGGEPVKVPPARAKQLVDTYVVGQPLEDAWTLAFAILGARICGRSPDPTTGL